MPAGKTKFQESWREKEDSNGTIIKKWCKAGSSVYLFDCLFCKSKNLKCDNNGEAALHTHAKSKQHVKNDKLFRNQGQLFAITKPKQDDKVSSEVPSTSKIATSGNIQVQQIPELAFKYPVDEIIKAEIIWSLHVSVENNSFRSCDSIGGTFKAMFPDSVVAKKFSLSRTKVSYMLSDGIGPAFHQQITDDVKKSSAPFTILYDEATTTGGKKQLDLHIKYFSPQKNEVATRFFQTFCVGHATSQILSDKILDSINDNGLQLQNLLALESDGPNVNKGVWQAVNEKVKNAGSSGLLNIGTCNLHVVHNSFEKGIKEYGNAVQEFAIDLHSFFSKKRRLRKFPV